MWGQRFVSARAHQACFPPSLWFVAMADTPRRQAGAGTNRPTRRRSMSRKRSVGETGHCCCTCNCKAKEDLSSKEELADTSDVDGSDDDSDHELKRALKTLGVVRVGGKWQRQEERASSTDSSSDSSEESEGEDKDIDAKMEALRQGS